MNLKFEKKLPIPQEIRESIPVSKEAAEVRKVKTQELKEVFEGKNDKFVLIIGPCSADNEDSVCEYIERLAKVQEKVQDKIIIVPRIYTNKPRTTGEGYKGMMSQPDPSKAPDLSEGIRAIRNLHIKALTNFHMPAADEMLYPENHAYLSDVLGYVAVGARSVENQQHRLTASGIDIPVGMKNPTCGDISVMLNSIKAAQLSHEFIYNNWEVKSEGNPLAHAILRGAVDSDGRSIPNYHYENLVELAKAYKEMQLVNPSIIVDCNHANSMKKHNEQPRIAREILMSRNYNSDLKDMVKGLMIESYIVGGRQEIGENVFGKSITDPCIGWEDSEKLIYFIAENL
ncbi:3-deoxy-7-phosphoheptulonate synthase [Clostridium hydrogenum]|uniref:3-deoxy-7-phosphoheptulonate synthase n=1 Tax=Clostridium hydrogenum TaxID=2855764 RepID=UPI001F337F8D|nr:3-deoxy-7-phosphoheptulonate synthase [Clostridium hydrogenum]